MTDFEKLGAFYLGRAYDVDSRATGELPLLYDAKDLTTHAVCVGMTGSGKTGLGISLLEEAAIDSIPAIVIDPKGDMGNLLLGFPELRPEDFEPWVDPGEAARKGQPVDAYAAEVARTWKEGLAAWGQDGERIRKLQKTADLAIYTPGSTAGLPLSMLRSFDAPPAAIREDREAFADRIEAAVSSLLALLGVDADPIQSREAILLSNILHRAWMDGRNLGIADLIGAIQKPPFQKLGVLDLDSFFPAKDRTALAIALNNLLASPGFATWMEGEPLDVARLLYTPEGRPRVSILSIAHLSDAERMFFVTTVLNEVVAWTRSQPGTGSLRALIYMDEIFGYFPPTANPPSKKPMLTLLKQARAYGVGIVLATQNPVDLDYKGLANTGTWFLGRMQTERDKARVLDGLEGAMTGSGKSFDRGEMDALLSGLDKRVFLMNNVHDDQPVVFRTRWALSYLRGPLTREDVAKLMEQRVPSAAAPASPTPPPRAEVAPPPVKASGRPVVPAGIREYYLPRVRDVGAGARLVYRPGVLTEGRLHFVKSPAKIDLWRELNAFALLADEEPAVDWSEAAIEHEQRETDLLQKAEEGAEFSELPAGASNAKSYGRWEKALKQHLYQSCAIRLYKSKQYKLTSKVGESEGDFRARVTHAAHELRDQRLEKLRKRYGTKLARVQERIRKAEERVGVQEEQYSKSKSSSLISMGTSLLGAIFSRKAASIGNVSRAGSALKSVGRASKEKADIERAQRDLEAERGKLADLEAEFQEEVDEMEDGFAAADIELEELTIRPRKSDIMVGKANLVWAPYRVDGSGLAEAAY